MNALPMTLEGRHVRLEPLEERHAADLFEVGRDAEIWRYMPRKPLASVEDAREMIRATPGAARDGSQVPFAIVERAGGRAIGSTRYLDVRAEHRGLEIGWTWLGKAWQRTARKAFCARTMVMPDGFVRDTVMYSITSKEWPAVKLRLSWLLELERTRPGARSQASCPPMGTESDREGGRVHRLRRLFDYDAWANREALASLAQGTDAPAKAVKVLAHVLGAERLWLERLVRAKPSGPVWPEATLDRMRGEIDDLSRRWEDYLDDLEPSDFDSEVEYVNSKGEKWSSTVGDILNHVLLHSSYHRGQIASELRAAGRDPAYTDFIHAVRGGFVE